MVSSQAGSIDGTTRQEVEAGEQENSGKKKAQSVVVIQPQRKQDVTALPKKVPSHRQEFWANISYKS